jgi:hypothetical protein
LSTPQSSLHSAFAVLHSGRELRTARAEVETKAPERTSALPRSEREHCDVVDIIPAIVWSALPDGSNVYVNSRFVEYSGMSAEQLAGSGWHAATHPDDLQPAFAHAKFLRTKYVFAARMGNTAGICNAACRYETKMETSLSGMVSSPISKIASAPRKRSRSRKSSSVKYWSSTDWCIRTQRRASLCKSQRA